MTTLQHRLRAARTLLQEERRSLITSYAVPQDKKTPGAFKERGYWYSPVTIDSSSMQRQIWRFDSAIDAVTEALRK